MAPVKVTRGEAAFWQTFTFPLKFATTLIEAVGNGLTVIAVADELAEHPDALVTVTVNEPDELTVIDDVVAPVLHK